jgi:hypothetical protein
MSPCLLQHLSRAQFPLNGPTLIQPNDLFAKQATINDNRVVVIQTAFILGFPSPLFVSLVQDPCSLPPGGYTWALTFDYQLTFGPIV